MHNVHLFRGRLKIDEKWTYNGLNVEVVDSFNYLGTVFKYNGNFALNYDFIIGKALKALNVILYNCKRYPMKPTILCQLFDAFVGSILSYSSEVWGFTKSKEIERVHLNFCKRILNIRMNSCSIGVYGELARYPLYIQQVFTNKMSVLFCSVYIICYFHQYSHNYDSHVKRSFTGR